MPFLLILFIFFTGCIHSQKIKKSNSSPKSYFELALKYKNKRNYKEALEKLAELNQRFFYSPYSRKALLLKADIYFSQDNYSKASSFYEEHFKLYPKKDTGYVLYQLGLSYKNQLPSQADKDLSHAEPALKALNKLLKLKTSSSYKLKAQVAKKEVLNKQADKEWKTILFYRKQGWNQASFQRVQYFTKNYKDSPLMPKVLLEGFEVSKILNKNSKVFKTKLIKHHPHSQETKSLDKKNIKSNLSQWIKKWL